MATVEHTPEHRTRVRDVLVGVTAGFCSNLMWVLVQVVVHRFG
ncbi:DUF6408 family protein [Streptomyces sp. NPDC048057]